MGVKCVEYNVKEVEEGKHFVRLLVENKDEGFKWKGGFLERVGTSMQ